MSPSTTPARPQLHWRRPDPLAHWLANTTAPVALAALIGIAAARLLRERGLHWSWAAGVLLAAGLLRSTLASLAPVVIMAALCTMMRARRSHREDLEAGADLADAAARRRRPVDLLRTAAGAFAVRLRRAGAPDGWFRAGEMIVGRDERGGLVSIPFGGSCGGTHTLLVGATGSGKTVTQTWMAVRAIERGMGAIVIDPKGDRDMRAAVADAAHAAGRRFIEWTPHGPSVYNPFARGSETEIADKVLAGERFTEPHYLRQAQRLLGHVVRSLRAAGAEVNLRAIAQHLDPTCLELLVRTLPADEARPAEAYLDSLTARQLSEIAGVRDRLAILAESDVGPWLDPLETDRSHFDLLEAVEGRERRVLRARRGYPAAAHADARCRDRRRPADDGRLAARPAGTDDRGDRRVLGARRRARRAAVRTGALGRVQPRPEHAGAERSALAWSRGTARAGDGQSHGRALPSPSRAQLGRVDREPGGNQGAWRTSQNGAGRVSRTRVREGALSPDAIMGLGLGCVAAIVLSDGRGARLARVLSIDESR